MHLNRLLGAAQDDHQLVYPTFTLIV